MGHVKIQLHAKFHAEMSISRDSYALKTAIFNAFFTPQYYYMACYYLYYPVLVGEDKSVSKKSTQKTFPPSEEKSFAPIKNICASI